MSDVIPVVFVPCPWCGGELAMADGSVMEPGALVSCNNLYCNSPLGFILDNRYKPRDLTQGELHRLSVGIEPLYRGEGA
jgi:hypothetical protein